MDMPAAPDRQLPERIGSRYDVIDRIGRGGMAVVYRVQEHSRSGELALKQLVISGASHERELRTLFEREFMVLAQLRHPSVVEVYDFGIDAVGPYYTMELLDGGDLSSCGPLPYAHACELIAQICSSLSLLHSRGFVHRDVSPRNVRFTRAGAAKLIDFGAMVPIGPCAQGVGTPGFVAPEVMHHLVLDARTDVFSLGATLYYALTGRRPFSARTLAELPEAWLKGPDPLGDVGSFVPPALEALIFSTLQMDPARRPNSAFEMRQRLAAISGKPLAESSEISQAYLSMPVLVGREAPLRQFRHYLRRCLQRDGLGLLIQGVSGSGRSRFLDMCLLELKTQGAVVLRADGRGARADPLATLHRLAEQLTIALPDESRACAVDTGGFDSLFAQDARLLPLARWIEQRSTVQAALPVWIERVCQMRPLAIAIDDVERVDEASLAVVVALVDAAAGTRLLVVSTTLSPVSRDAPAALAVLHSQCTRLAISPLTAAESDELFTSVFSGAPHVALVSDRIHKLSTGNPREALALAQHLLDRGVIRHAEGNWILPSELALSELPASSEEALRTQLSKLSPLQRQLIEAQALAFDGPWSLSDYLALDPSRDQERVTDAVSRLLQEGLVVENAGAYTLNHSNVRACAISQLSAAARVEHERELASMCACTGRAVLVQLKHLLAGGEHERAIALLGTLLQTDTKLRSLYDQSSGISGTTVGSVLEHAQAVLDARKHPGRARYDLARLLAELSIPSDDEYYYRHAAAWREQLEQDSGVRDYWASDPTKSSAERLQIALQTAAGRFDATPEGQRVYRVDEAIRALAHYVSISIAIGARASDTRLLASLPPLLEPFSTLSPILYALWQNTIAVTELAYKGQIDRARTRLTEIYRDLERATTHDAPYLDAIRNAVAHAIAFIDVSLGNPAAELWLAKIEQDPLQRVNALYFRRAQCIFDGDSETAERYRKQAEVLAVQATTRQMFQPPLTLELYLQVHAGDLTGVRHAADRIAELAAQSPGWIGQHHLAQGSFHRLRGDLPAARAAFEHAMEAESPTRTDPPPLLRVWGVAAEGYTAVLEGMGLFEEAREFAQRACDTCEALEVSSLYGISRALALVEARLGQYARAAARLDAVIEKRAHLRPSVRALDFEARAKVAIWAGDAAAAAHYTRLATEDAAAHGGVQRLARRGRLLDEARRMGLSLDIPQAGVESTLHRSSVRPEHAYAHAARALVAAAFGPLPSAAARAQRALELLAEALRSRVGHLYYAGPLQLAHRAVLGGATDPALDRFANGYFRQRREQEAMTTVFTAPQLDAFALETGTWSSPTGVTYVLIPLSPVGEAECVGLVALAATNPPIPPEYWAMSAAISARLIESGDVAVQAIGA